MLTDNPKLVLRKRRWMVAAYYAGAIALAPVGIEALHWGIFRRSTLGAGVFFPLVTAFVGLLGGVSPGGPVRPFAQPKARAAGSAPPSGLSPGSRKRPIIETPLDERDRAIRDRAHYQAMIALRIAVGLFAVAIWVAIDLKSSSLGRVAGVGAYALVVLAMTLPQAILLWTEPDPAPDSSSTGTLAGVA